MITVSGCLGSPTYQEPPGIPRERTGGGGAEQTGHWVSRCSRSSNRASARDYLLEILRFQMRFYLRKKILLLNDKSAIL